MCENNVKINTNNSFVLFFITADQKLSQLSQVYISHKQNKKQTKKNTNYKPNK